MNSNVKNVKQILKYVRFNEDTRNFKQQLYIFYANEVGADV